METSSLSIATIRALGIDTINKANSGHPGMVLGSTPAIYTLFTKEMDFITNNQNGLTAIVLYWLLVMLQHCYIQCCIYLVIKFLLMT